MAVRPGDKVLLLETMYFEDEIRDPEQELDSLPPVGNANARELSIAKDLVDSLTDEWEPGRYKNTYRTRVEELVQRKRDGNAIVVGTDSPRKTQVVDLMSALQASIERSRSSRRPNRTAAKTTSTKKGPSITVSAHREKKGLAAMTKADLLERAKKSRIDVSSSMTKAELIHALESRPKTKSSRQAS